MISNYMIYEMTTRLRSKERENSRDNMKGSALQQQFLYIEIPISPTDTLLALSMKFGVSIVDLKRMNSLLNDRDMYALKSFMVPIKPNSLLAQEYAGQLKYGDPNMSRLNIIGRLDLMRDDEIDETRTAATEPTTDDSEDEQEVYNAANAGFELVDLSTPVDAEGTVMETRFMSGRSKPAAKKASTSKTALLAMANDDADDYDADNYDKATTSLLADPQSSTNYNIEKGLKHKKRQAQLKEAKKFFKKLDTNLETLKHQNLELQSTVAPGGSSSSPLKMEQLIPISNISYTVDANLGHAASKKKRSIGLREIAIIACIMLILVPVVVLTYNFYFSHPGDEHDSSSQAAPPSHPAAQQSHAHSG